MITLFPGQGSQHIGMMKELFENFDVVRHSFEEASDCLKMDFKKLALDGPESEQNLTENTQPLLLTASISVYRLLDKQFHFKPSLVAGHSLGEYSALVTARAFDFGTALTWVKFRGRAMQEAVPVGTGSMMAVLGGEDTQVEELCKEASKEGGVVEAANYNAPGQIVISGSTEGLASAQLLAKTDKFSKLKLLPLPVSAPFHSSLMKSARNKMAGLFKDYLTRKKISELQCPYIPNRTARPTQEAGVVLDLLVEQMDHSVLWRQSVERMLDDNKGAPLRALELGPGKVLQGLVKRIAKAKSQEATVLSISDLASLQTFEKEWKP